MKMLSCTGLANNATLVFVCARVLHQIRCMGQMWAQSCKAKSRVLEISCTADQLSLFTGGSGGSGFATDIHIKHTGTS